MSESAAAEVWLGRLTEQHLTRYCLEACARVRSVTPLTVYTWFLKSVIYSKEMTSTLVEIPDRHFEKYYRAKAPLTPPAFLDGSQYTMMLHLFQCCNLQGVILEVMANGGWRRRYDPRFYARPDLYIMIRNTGDVTMVRTDLWLGPPPLLLESRFIGPRSERVGDCYVQALQRLLQQQPVTAAPTCPTLTTLLYDSAWTEPPVLLMTHVMHAAKAKGQPYFKYVGFLAGQADTPTLARATVVVLTAHAECYTLRAPWSERVRRHRLALFQAQQPQLRPEHPTVASAEAETAPNAPEAAWLGPDHCAACRDYRTDAARLPRLKRDRLYYSRLSSFDYLRMLNKDTAAWRAHLVAVHAWCVAAYDIESMLQPLGAPMQQPAHGVSTTFLPPGGQLLGRQVPALIGYTDHRGATQTVTLDETQDSPHQHLMQAFVTVVDESRNACVAEKKRLLAPIMEFLAGYKEAHMKFFAADAGAARASWQRSLWGQFETHLAWLTQLHVVFGFNSARYDLCLILPGLATELKRRFPRAPMRVSKSGHSVNALSCGKLRFVDALKLGPSGVSLRQLSSMLDVPLTKSIFPFEQFTSMAFLREPQLPAEARAWHSTLTVQQITQAQVDEARQTFTDRGFANIHAYLDYYLKLDVDILMECLKRLFNTYYELLQLLPFDMKTFSISAFSYTAGLHALMRARHVGFFQPHQPVMHHLLQRGCRGGLCQMYRSVAGRDAPWALFEQEEAAQAAAEGRPPHPPGFLAGCNAPWVGAGAQPAHQVLALDKNSLYPAVISK